MSFHMVIPITPKSAQGKSGKSTSPYTQAIAQAARAVMGTGGFLQGNLYARIVWFHKEHATTDVDNIVKPILDALKNTVYADDNSIVKCVSERVDARSTYQIDQTSISGITNRNLLILLADTSKPHVLYMEVGTIQARLVVFGPIDGV